jgi:ATP synthase in type III secretion protein N
VNMKLPIFDRTSLSPRLAAWGAAVGERMAKAQAFEIHGRVERVSATLIVARLPHCRVGHLCELDRHAGDGTTLLAEVIGFDGKDTVLAPLGSTDGIAPHTRVRLLGIPHEITVGTHLLGQVLDGFGRPLAKHAAAPHDPASVRARVLAAATPPTDRLRIVSPLSTGVRAIDALLTLGRGQRIGLFASPGCGKTTLMGALARGIEADVVVFALVGERGRELNEFLERELDSALAARSVVVCATSDCSPMERARAAFTATAIAEGWRATGKHVLLLVDSLTRLARAQREIGLAAGEPPGRLGFPPSVYSMLPRLLERAGNGAQGAITAIYTVLVESETADPIGEEARSLLDGHIVLTRKLVELGHFPAIDVLASLSRTMNAVVPESHGDDAARFRTLLARHQQLELLITLGEYQAGNDELNDEAVARHPRLMEFLRQDVRALSRWEHTLEQLHATVRG